MTAQKITDSEWRNAFRRVPKGKPYELKQEYMTDAFKDRGINVYDPSYIDDFTRGLYTDNEIKKRKITELPGYIIYDDPNNKEYQVSYLELGKQVKPVQHYHTNSNALFRIVSMQGDCKLLNGPKEYDLEEGKYYGIPKRMAHGFKIPPGGKVTLLSFQYPPIKQANEEEDVHPLNTELVKEGSVYMVSEEAAAALTQTPSPATPPAPTQSGTPADGSTITQFKSSKNSRQNIKT